jgi:DNA-binding response OmpR family regulator
MAKILIIDDDPDIIKTLEIRFTTEGYKVSSASNGEEGLRQVDVQKPDLIVLDAMMPKMDGVEFSQHLRQDKRYGNLLILLLSGLVYIEGEPQDKEIADAYMAKPFDGEALVKKVQELLKTKK